MGGGSYYNSSGCFLKIVFWKLSNLAATELIVQEDQVDGAPHVCKRKVYVVVIIMMEKGFDGRGRATPYENDILSIPHQEN